MENVDSDDKEDKQKGLMEQGLERVQHDQEEEDGKNGAFLQWCWAKKSCMVWKDKVVSRDHM